jgi:hypothetical protein
MKILFDITIDSITKMSKRANTTKNTTKKYNPTSGKTNFTFDETGFASGETSLNIIPYNL